MGEPGTAARAVWLLVALCAGLQWRLVETRNPRRLDSDQNGPDRDTLRYADSRYAQAWLENTNRLLRHWCYLRAEAEWNFSVNVTEENENKMSEVVTRYSLWYQGIKQEAAKFQASFLDRDSARQIRLLLQAINSRDNETVRETSHIRAEMMKIYDTGRVCMTSRQCLQLEPGLETVMSRGRQPREMLWAWRGWHYVTGPPMRPLYSKFIHLTNKAAVENGYVDFGDYIRQATFDETPGIEEMAEELWQRIRPLYLQLHAYVRRRLVALYGDGIVGTSGAIPAHILGNMWAQEWTNIYNLVTPYPAANREKTAERRVRARFKTEDLFRLAEKFFTSIDMFAMTPAFWNHSMLRRPRDREVQCHASALDMFHDNDFRIKMCTEVDLRHLETIHHEMGHVQYFMAYAQQPTVYRDGANCAFHEAVGDTMALSVLSTKHLVTIGLLPKEDAAASKKSDINSLMRTALYKVAFLPFGLLVDKWRYAVWRGDINETNYNRKWWEMRLKYQGVIPPLPRSEKDFDPGAKFHIPANSPYICYFFSNIVQFQFYKALCEASGHIGPLYQCDFYRSQAAGHKLRSMLQLGQSVSWPDALETLTGKRVMSADALLEYFQPLMEWLRQDNQKHGVHLGWDGAMIPWTSDH